MLYTSRGMSTTTPTFLSKSTGVYKTAGAASGSKPSNCMTDRVLRSSWRSGWWNPTSPRQSYMVKSNGVHTHVTSMGVTSCIGWRKDPHTHEEREHRSDIAQKADPVPRDCAQCVEDTRLLKCVIFRELVWGAVSTGGRGGRKGVNLRAF